MRRNRVLGAQLAGVPAGSGGSEQGDGQDGVGPVPTGLQSRKGGDDDQDLEFCRECKRLFTLSPSTSTRTS